MKKATIIRYKLKVIGIGCATTLRVLFALTCAAGAAALYWLTGVADGYLAVIYFVAAMMLTVKATDFLYKCGAWVMKTKEVKQ
jgi:hypothetical protein